MINTLARLGDRLLRGVLPAAEAQACTVEWKACGAYHYIGTSEYWACCTNSCGKKQCTLNYYGTTLGCSFAC